MNGFTGPATHVTGSLMHGATRLHFLADDTDTGDELHKAGPIAIVVIIVLIVASFFLFKSMSAQLRKVRENFPPAPDDNRPDGPDARVSDGRSSAVEPTKTEPTSAAVRTARPSATSKSRAPSSDSVTRRSDAGGPGPT